MFDDTIVHGAVTIFLKPEFGWLLGAASLAGLIRGFSGFGAALLFIPLASMIVAPTRAVVLLFIIDGIIALPLLKNAVRHVNWREVLPLSLGAGVTVPLGAMFLVYADPIALRWLMSALALGAVGALASGWRYHRAPGQLISGGVGMVSGFLGGMTSFYGPPIIIFWLGGQNAAATVRSNIIIFFGLMTLVAGITYATHGLFSWDIFYQAMTLMPAYAISIWVGSRMFGKSSESFFRWAAYSIIAGVAVSSSPGFGTHGE